MTKIMFPFVQFLSYEPMCILVIAHVTTLCAEFTFLYISLSVTNELSEWLVIMI